jgi:hypothetical protein
VTSSSARRYLLGLLLIFCVSFGLVWLYVVRFPMAFLDEEYARWDAKQEMLNACDLGDVLVVGDSRAAVDIAPARLGVKATNLALAGSSPIEMFVTLRRALRCVQRPRLVIISFSPAHFVAPDTFWSKSARYRFLTYGDLMELRRNSAAIGDWSIYRDATSDGLPPLASNWIYGIDFPPLYFSSLVEGDVFLRYWKNVRTRGDVLRSRGQYFFAENESGTDALAPEAAQPAFAVLPIMDRYFDLSLALLARNGVASVFLGMPINESTARVLPPAYKQAFEAYLRGYAAKYAGFSMADDPLPHWPDRYIGDRLSHFNSSGVERYDPGLAGCLPAMMGQKAGGEDCRLIGWTKGNE